MWSKKTKMKKILIIVSTYYKEVSDNLLNGAEKILRENNLDFEVKKVDGSLEIPFFLKKYIEDYDGYIILGCVIKGETDHYEVVKNISLNNIYKIAYENEVALASALLTVKNFEQALERSKIDKKNLGGQAAKVCINLLKVL